MLFVVRCLRLCVICAVMVNVNCFGDSLPLGGCCLLFVVALRCWYSLFVFSFSLFDWLLCVVLCCSLLCVSCRLSTAGLVVAYRCWLLSVGCCFFWGCRLFDVCCALSFVVCRAVFAVRYVSLCWRWLFGVR